MKVESILLEPKKRFLSIPATANTHSDLMASPSFQHAASTAMLAYQYQLGGGSPEALSIVAAKLRGAQEFLHCLLNLGLPNSTEKSIPDASLVPPEESLNRPFNKPN